MTDLTQQLTRRGEATHSDAPSHGWLTGGVAAVVTGRDR
jgi:hypothetical protein